MSLDTRITDFATLVALVFVLITLFTGQRAAAVVALRQGPATERGDVLTEIWVDLVLIFATALLFLIGLPIVLDAIEHLHPLRYSGPLRGGFIVTWLLLLGLVFWQWRVFHAAHALLAKYPKSTVPPSPAIG